MPVYKYICDTCGNKTEVFWSIAEMEAIEKQGLECTCGNKLERDWKMTGRHRPFKPFKVKTKTLRGPDGGPLEITSLQQIRQLEKQHSDIGLCFDAFSYDNFKGKSSLETDYHPPGYLKEQELKKKLESQRELVKAAAAERTQISVE